MARLVVLVVALLVIRNVSAECFNENGVNANESVCIPGHWNFVRVKSVNVLATSTCGNPSSTFCRMKPDNGCFKCNSSDPKFSHPVEYIVDKPSGAITYWLSQTWWDWHQIYPNEALKVNVTINFNKSFDATGLLSLTFESVRPYGMILEKSSDFGKTWQVLQYYASNCQVRFGMKHIDPTENRRGDFTATCTEAYSKFQPQKGGQVVFDFKKRYEEEAEFFKTDVQKYLLVTNFRIQLLYPGTDGLESGSQTENILRNYYYGISDMTAIGRCRCNGHAAYCGYNNSVYGINKCVDCMHFTTGVDCDKCLPLYNNRTWMPATSRFQPNPCQRCECHDHADSCVYDKKLGYGVCQDCYHNTTGHFCQECKDMFYRNISLSLRHPGICLACNCFTEGILNNGSCNVNNGQCLCRQNVTGRRCDRCVDTYWGYRVPPIGHCTACNCLFSGTKNGSLNCDQMTGQCTCKDNIDQKSCTRCKHGFYKFPKNIVDDCLECDCDYGGSSSEICNKNDGRCKCRKNIQGTRCTVVPPGYFTGSFNYFRLEAEQSGGVYEYTSNTKDLNKYFTGTGAAKLTPWQYIVFETKTDNTFKANVILGYKVTYPEYINNELKIRITAPGTGNCTAITSKTITVNGLEKGQGKAWLSRDAITVCKGQEFTFNVSFSNGAVSNASIEIDFLTLYPALSELRIYEVAKEKGSVHGFDVATIEGCWNNWTTLAGTNHSQPICKNISFSSMAQILDGALPCGCNSVGSVSNTTCDQDGGQCHCKPGVTGRTCDYCKPGYYNLTSTGCTECKCNSVGSRHLVCNAATGQCPCKPGVVTRTCERCNHTYYGFDTGNGCVDCKCNASGSADLQCHGVTGVCPCKNSTDGEKCDQCRHGYYNYTTEGCQSCHCDKDGSSTLQCHLQTGRCDCKANVQGFKCNECKKGFFNRDFINPTGCTPCYCYGRSSTCVSSKGFVKSFIESNPVNNSWQPDRGIRNMRQDINRKTITIQYQNGESGTLLVSDIKGPLFRSYAQRLTFELKFLSPQGLSVNLSVLIEPSNGLTRTELTLNPRPSVNVTTYHALLHEKNSVRPITAKQLQDSLAHVINMKLKAEFKSNGSMEISLAKLSTAKEGSVGEYAGNVENCTCNERNYTSLSCQLCHEGYTRYPSNKEKTVSDPPQYGTRCELCSCTNRSKNCDGETGRCKNCRTGSMGYFCDKCQPGVDNKTDCNQCFPGYYGLYLNKFEGCGACNCLLTNTLYGNQSICAFDDGQCVCKANISGRICDRCHENAYNNSQGHCIDCPICFRLLQIFVHELRGNISTVEGALYNLRNGGSGDATFEKRLVEAEQNVRRLVKKAANSTDIEKDLHSQLQSLNQTLDDMEALLTGVVTSGTASLEGVVTAASRDRNRTKELIKLTEKMISDGYGLLNTSVDILMNQASQSEQYLNLFVPVFGALEKEAISLATSQNRTGRDIIDSTNAAALLVQEANYSSLQTVLEHKTNTEKIRQLLVDCESVKNLGLQAQNTASLLLRNSTRILINARMVLQSVNALNASNQAELKEISTTIQSLANNVTAALAMIDRFNNEYKTQRETVERSLKQTATMMAQVSVINYDATAILKEARRAQTEAKTAVASAEKTHSDAKEMSQILQDFKTKANDSQQLAATALERSKEANQTSQKAIEYSQNINASIQATLRIANQGLNIATTARDLAKKESQDISSVYSQAMKLKSDADSTRHSPENFGKIKTNVTNIALQIESAVSACKENYTRYSADAKEKSTKALNDASKASNSIRNAKTAVEEITKEFNKLQQVNATRLRELQDEIKRLRVSFEQKDVSNLNKNLQAAKEQQQKFIENYKQQVQNLREQVNEMKMLRDSLRSVPHRGCT